MSYPKDATMKIIWLLLLFINILFANSLVIKESDVKLLINGQTFDMKKDQNLTLEVGTKVCFLEGNGKVIINFEGNDPGLISNTKLYTLDHTTSDCFMVEVNEIYPIIDYESLQTCYRFGKESFRQSLKIPEDIIVGWIVAEIDPEPVSTFLSFQFPSSDQNPSLDVQCSDLNMKDKKECYRDNFGNHIQKVLFELKDDAMYLHTTYFQIPYRNENHTIHHTIESKDHKLSKGVKVPCTPTKALIRVPNIKNGSKKQKLLKSIDITDVIIHDIDYNKNLVIAVGESNTLEDRLFRAQHGNYLRQPIALLSIDGGTLWRRIQKEYWGVDYFNKVSIKDKKNILIIGLSHDKESSSSFISSDAGKNWEEVSENTDK